MRKIIKGIESITLFSENPSELYRFYKDTVGVKFNIEAELGEGEDLYGYEAEGKTGLYIVHHSEISGKAKEPKRAIINFEVEDIEAEFERLKKEGVKVVQEVYHVEDYGYIATLEDPDGNYFQIVKVRE